MERHEQIREDIRWIERHEQNREHMRWRDMNRSGVSLMYISPGTK